MRRIQNEIKGLDQICDVIEKCPVCRLAINNGEYPYIVPLNFGYERKGDKLFLYFHGANTGTKKALIEKNGKVGFEMDMNEQAEIREVACDSYMDYKSVCGIGNATFLNGNEKKNALEKIMKHYTNKSYEMREEAIAATMVIQVEVAEITGKFHKTPKN